VTRFALIVAGCLGAATLLLAPAAAAKGPGVTLTEAGGAKFPERAFVVGLPASRLLTADSVRVFENGQSVVDVTLVPASAAGKTTFGVVLVVDASDSMHGAPLDAAMAAARAFAARRNPNERLALLTFNNSPTIALPFTSSKTQIDAALASLPHVGYGTHIYDAVGAAEALLRQAKVESGSIVLLSDGADTGSTHNAASVARVARASGIKLFTVGLQSAHFDSSTLRGLAAQGGGEYALANSPSALQPLFDQLSARLASEYLLRYKSLAGPQAQVKVEVTVAGSGSAASAYRTPALPIKGVPPYRPSLARRFWGSPIVTVVLALLVAGVVALLAIGLLLPRRSGLPARMAEFVSVPGLQSQARRTSVLASDAGGDATAASSGGFMARLDELLEIAHIETSAAGLLAWTAAGTVIAFFLLDVAIGSRWWALFAVVGPFAVREWVVRRLARRRKQFSEQLPDTLQVVSSALRSGHSFAGALAVVVEASSEPMKSEMQRVVADEQLGVPLERAIAVVVRRMQNRDLEQVGLVAQLQRDAGGNAAEVVDRVSETIRERFELRRLVSTLTVQGRMSRWIVSGLPVALVALLSIINPHYLHPLVATLGGKILLGVAAGLVVAGSFVIKKIVDIKV
jgi:tight adherence protein B